VRENPLAVEFAILGPLKVSDGDCELTPGREKQRALLAMLLLRANEVVATDELVEGLWGESPPATAANALHGHVSSLRKRLGVERIETQAGGYRLRVDAGELDLARFEELVAEARRRVDPQRRSIQLGEALELWRGEPLADLRYVDVRHVLPAIRAPTLVLHRSGDGDTRVEEGRYVAERIPGARFVELPGDDHFVAIDPDQILDEVERFVLGLQSDRRSHAPTKQADPPRSP
jgi:pimeloyl-ACP methyl ester carboxylesterase